MTQTIFYIIQNMIVGLDHHRWKQCKWCEKTFMPYHNKQAFCDDTCRTLYRSRYKSDWMYHRRNLEREGHIVNDRSILNVGTGGLGEHRRDCFEDEMKEVRKELKKIRSGYN